MTEKTETEVAQIGVNEIDEAYLTWFGAESECEDALRTWFAGAGAAGYLTYRAALDREEAAARELGRLWGLAQSRAHTPVGTPS